MRDPRRRNRNIGTSKQGHGQDNRMVIPKFWDKCGRVYYGQLKSPRKMALNAGLHLLVEPTLPDFFHPCVPQEIVDVLVALTRLDVCDIKAIVLRQPTRNQHQLRPVWGRLQYFSDMGRYCGPAIFLEAQTVSPLRWGKKLNKEDENELERLESDGHRIEHRRRDILIHSTPEAMVRTQLYRTLPHEIGHYVDYLEKVARPAGDDHELWDKLWTRYHSRPVREKEEFANAYAAKVRHKVAYPIRDKEQRLISAEGMELDAEWFFLAN